MNIWQLQDAKAHFNEIIKKAIDEGPQTITVHGKETVVIISKKELEKNQRKSKISLVEFLRKSPLHGIKLDISRDKSLCRKK
jgi:prevent-host-death family protein